MIRVINNFHKPVTLDDGTILAAPGTEGSARDNVNLSARDKRRYVDSGMIAVVEVDDAPKPKKEVKA